MIDTYIHMWFSGINALCKKRRYRVGWGLRKWGNRPREGARFVRLVGGWVHPNILDDGVEWESEM